MTQIQTGLATVAAAIINFINGVAVPLVFALAFIIFLFGIFKYFFVKGVNSATARTEGTKFMMWGIIAFAVMLSVWGLVNIVRGTLWLDNSQPNLPGFNLNGSSGSGSVPSTNDAAGHGVPSTNDASGGGVPSTNDSATSPAPSQNNLDQVKGLY